MVHMTKGMRSITEKTLVPLGLVIMICGGVVWLTEMSVKSNEVSKSVDEIKVEAVKREERYYQVMRQIDVKYDVINERLSRIEGWARHGLHTSE